MRRLAGPRGPTPPRAVRTPRSLDADAANITHALASRAAPPPASILDGGRALIADVAATRAPPSPACARAIDATCGTLARAWRAGHALPTALDRDVRTLRCVAAARHASLAARDLTAALMVACRRALADDVGAGFGERQLATIPAAAAAVRAATCLGHAPPPALLDGLVAALTLSIGAPFALSSGATPPPAAVVDLLCAAAATRHALPPAAALTLADTPRFTPVQAAAAGAALAMLAAPPPPRLVSTLRVRVAGARAGMPPAAAAAAAVALAVWRSLDAASAASLLDAASVGLDGPAALASDDWTCMHAALATVADPLPSLTPRAARGRGVAADAAAAHCADRVKAGPPGELVALARVAGLRVEGPSVITSLEWVVMIESGTPRPKPEDCLALTITPPSSNAPHVPLQCFTTPHAACVTAAAAAAAAARGGGVIDSTVGVIRVG